MPELAPRDVLEGVEDSQSTAYWGRQKSSGAVFGGVLNAFELTKQ